MVPRGPGEADLARWNQIPKLFGPLWVPEQRGVRDAAKISDLETGRMMMSLLYWVQKIWQRTLDSWLTAGRTHKWIPRTGLNLLRISQIIN